MTNIVMLDGDTLGPGVNLRQIAVSRFDEPWRSAQWISYPDTGPDQLADRLAGAGIAVTNKVTIPGELMAELPELKHIAVAATGTNVVDLEAARRHGISVSNIRGYATATVPEHVFALMLALRRTLTGTIEDVKAGMWQQAGSFCLFTRQINDLRGYRLGIIGRGELGQAVARIAEGFGMEVVFAGRKGMATPPAPYLPFDEVIASSDIITLHCPLTDTTRDLIAAPEFDRMTKRPIIINTARGGIVNETDLIAALQAGKISGAGMDVTFEEPPAADHPFMALLDRPDFILTPHVAWASVEARQFLADQLIDNIENFMKGTPSNLVT